MQQNCPYSFTCQCACKILFLQRSCKNGSILDFFPSSSKEYKASGSWELNVLLTAMAEITWPGFTLKKMKTFGGRKGGVEILVYVYVGNNIYKGHVYPMSTALLIDIVLVSLYMI